MPAIPLLARIITLSGGALLLLAYGIWFVAKKSKTIKV